MLTSVGTVKPSALAQSSIRSLFFDIERMIPGNPFIKTDLSYLERRLGAEGDRFLFTVLPLLGKAVEKSLIQEAPLLVPPGWSLMKESRLPTFMNALFKRAFAEDGTPLQPMSEEGWLCCKAIRQLTLVYSKVEGCVEDTLRINAIEKFKSRTQRDFHPEHPCLPLAREILERVFDRRSHLVYDLVRFQREPWGKHGPGAVADRSSPGEKWDFSRWKGIPERLFQFSDTLAIKPKIGAPLGARVTCVPKDFKGPRIICIEPKELQFAQQGLMKTLYTLLQRHPLTRGSIDFQSTRLSERLCFDSNVGTIDLKDASDNLSLGLARAVLPRWVFKLVTRYRSRTITNDGETWTPRCLATMGNACCFPLQTVIFWAIARSVISAKSWRSNTPLYPLRVFGDDIIAPREACEDIILALEGCGLIINKEKTCIRTLVKESCGEWVLAGKTQRLIKVKATDIRNMRDMLAYTEYSYSARTAGFYSLAATWEQAVEDFLPESSLKRRYNRKLQRLEVRRPVLCNTGDRAELDGSAGLYAWHVHNDTAPYLNGTIKVKKRWVA